MAAARAARSLKLGKGSAPVKLKRPAETPSAAALHSLDKIAFELEQLKTAFVPPTSLSYAPAATAASPTLDFSTQNKALLEYGEQLLRLLLQLDTVGSGGSLDVREARKVIVRNVEHELVRVDEIKAMLFGRTAQEADALEREANGKRRAESGNGSPHPQPPSQAKRKRDRKRAQAVEAGEALAAEQEREQTLASQVDSVVEQLATLPPAPSRPPGLPVNTAAPLWAPLQPAGSALDPARR